MSQQTPANCCTLKCARLSARDKRQVVWTVGEKCYCNVCFLNELESEKFDINDSITRLYEDDNLYQDIRTIKRRKRISQPNPCGPPIRLRA